MPQLTPEQRARQQIDAMLVASGWAVQDYTRFNPAAGRSIALREALLKSGTCDYLLLVDRKALGVVEAKKHGTLLSGVAEQSGHYAENLPDFIQSIAPRSLPFLYESTGVETFFRDERDPEPRSRRVFSFHRPKTLAALVAQPTTLRARLAAIPTAHPLPVQNLRACQVEGITNLEESFAADRPRALIQMATGAGKTYTACSFTYRLIKHAGAKRVLFLVDRANLGRQALAEFQQFVAPDTGRKFTEVYNVQHLTTNQLDSVAQRLTEQMLKDLEAKLKQEPQFGPDPVNQIWRAFKVTGNAGSGDPAYNTQRSANVGRLPSTGARACGVPSRNAIHRFADLVSLVRFALEQQPVLEPFAESVTTRFNEWLMDKAKAGAKFTAEQLAWLNLIRDHIATSLSIEPDDFDDAAFSQRGGLGKAHQLFGEQPPKLLDELNEVLAA